MHRSLRDVAICIPTKRMPPVRTLESYRVPDGIPVYLIADPSVYKLHRRLYRGVSHVHVVKGADRWLPQVGLCYDIARSEGYRYFFRMDDDLIEKTFIRRDRSYPSLEKVIRWARKCIDVCDVSLAGFCNTSRIDWLGRGYGNSYALVHGGAHIAESIRSKDVIDTRLYRYEDVYRSCAHRERDGAVGRVKFVGLNKRPSQQKTSIVLTEEQRQRSIKIILKRFPEFVSYHGEKTSGKDTYPKFVYRRHPGYRS